MPPRINILSPSLTPFFDKAKKLTCPPFLIAKRLFSSSAISIPHGLTAEDLTHDFFREVLLTYRLIFGQTPTSFSDFSTILPTLQADLENINITPTTASSSRSNNSSNPTFSTGISSISTESNKTAYSKKSSNSNNGNPNTPPDPLFPLLTTRSPTTTREAADIYDVLDAPDPGLQHCPMADFPFFGRRLGEVQDYVRGCHPTTFLGIWNDKRDALAWWTIWVCFLNFLVSIYFIIIWCFRCLFILLYFNSSPLLCIKSNLTSSYRQ